MITASVIFAKPNGCALIVAFKIIIKQPIYFTQSTLQDGSRTTDKVQVAYLPAFQYLIMRLH